MSLNSAVTVTVPATTANLGPGFDCLGAALTLYNQFKFTRVDSVGSSGVRITVTGAEAHLVKTDKSNLVYQSFVKLYKLLGQMPPAVQIEIELSFPLARGLGSSATAIVGGLMGANHLAGEPLDQGEVMRLAIDLEGHPDNVVPALVGGCRLAARGLVDEPLRRGQPRGRRDGAARNGFPSVGDREPEGVSRLERTARRGERRGGEGEWEVCDVAWHSDVVPVVAIPDFELSTQEARRVLPDQVSRADAIFNTAHLGLLVRGLETGRGDWLRGAMQDRLHQPYRQVLIPGYEVVRSAAVAAGAYGMVISGAGPTLLALTSEARSGAVAVAMATAWQEEGITAQARSLQIDSQGAKSLFNP